MLKYLFGSNSSTILSENNITGSTLGTTIRSKNPNKIPIVVIPSVDITLLSTKFIIDEKSTFGIFINSFMKINKLSQSDDNNLDKYLFSIKNCSISDINIDTSLLKLYEDYKSSDDVLYIYVNTNNGNGDHNHNCEKNSNICLISPQQLINIDKIPIIVTPYKTNINFESVKFKVDKYMTFGNFILEFIKINRLNEKQSYIFFIDDSIIIKNTTFIFELYEKYNKKGILYIKVCVENTFG
jgi:hypothetical protein